MITSTLAIALSAAFMTITSCKKDKSEDELKEKTTYGKAVNVGDGMAKTWVHLSADGKPMDMGIMLSKEAMDNLPADHEEVEFMLTLPKEAGKTLFQVVNMGWNPHGHEPAGVYDQPHFDFHFYMISDAERMQITGLAPTEMDSAIPAAKYMPADYIQTSGRVPAMGVHWVDVTSPELNGQLFTRTFIMGTANSKVNFYEPMITRAYLLSKANETFPIKKPAAVEKDGYYPTEYSVTFDAKSNYYKITLQGFEYRKAS